MKMLFCCNCQDIVKIQRELRQCMCGKSRAQATDTINVWHSGPSKVLGISNPSLVKALYSDLAWPEGIGDGRGHRIESFIIPVTAPSVEYRANDSLELALTSKYEQ